MSVSQNVEMTNCTEDGQLQLVGGKNNLEGRLEICFRGIWGTVCHDSWDNRDAEVACRQLGLNTTRPQALREVSYFGKGTGPVLLDGVDCTGSEQRLTSCQRFDLEYVCGGFKDAGVRCPVGGEKYTSQEKILKLVLFTKYIEINTTLDGQLRLVGGRDAFEGRLEILYGGFWGSVCDDSWDSRDAEVVCRQLGLNTTRAFAFGMAPFGQGTGPIHLDEVGCTGREQTLISCPHNDPVGEHNCVHYEDAGVRCHLEGKKCALTAPNQIMFGCEINL